MAFIFFKFSWLILLRKVSTLFLERGMDATRAANASWPQRKKSVMTDRLIDLGLCTILYQVQ